MAKYLVLRSFTSYGKRLRKGTIVDEAEIRNPRLRRSEKKIYPVVSSSNPVETEVDDNQKPSTPDQQLKPEETKIKLDFNLNKNLSLG